MHVEKRGILVLDVGLLITGADNFVLVVRNLLAFKKMFVSRLPTFKIHQGGKFLNLDLDQLKVFLDLAILLLLVIDKILLSRSPTNTYPKNSHRTFSMELFNKKLHLCGVIRTFQNCKN